MTDVLVISGRGPYADDWHDFPATSARVAELVADLGYSVGETGEVDAALQQPVCRLLLVNIGRRSPPPPDDLAAGVRSGLDEHLRSGGALLGLHATISSMATVPAWRRILGGAWIHGQTMHPPKGAAEIVSSEVEHPINADLPRVVVDDERYSYLDTEPDIQILYEHEHDELWHPLVWAREQGAFRVVYDGLGHDVGSFDSPDHQDLLRRSVRWLLHELPP